MVATDTASNALRQNVENSSMCVTGAVKKINFMSGKTVIYFQTIQQLHITKLYKALGERKSPPRPYSSVLILLI